MDLDDFNRPAPNIPIVLDEVTVDFVVPAAVPAKARVVALYLVFSLLSGVLC